MPVSHSKTKFRMIHSSLFVYFMTIFLDATAVSADVIDESESRTRSFFDFVAVDIDDRILSLRQYEGKVLLVVNVASECGYTDGHYRSLVDLQNKLVPDFTVLAFPCNQFGNQEPGTNKEIKNFAEKTYGVNFPMFSKINVINDNVPDFWAFLTNEAKAVPNWNFWKYLVDKRGKVVHAWGPWVSVESITPYVVDLTKYGKVRGLSDEL